jgi:hypothetical protein
MIFALVNNDGLRSLMVHNQRGVLHILMLINSGLGILGGILFIVIHYFPHLLSQRKIKKIIRIEMAYDLFNLVFYVISFIVMVILSCPIGKGSCDGYNMVIAMSFANILFWTFSTAVDARAIGRLRGNSMFLG